MADAEGSDPAVKELLERSEELRQKADHLLEEFAKLSEKIKRLESAAAKALVLATHPSEPARPPEPEKG